MRASASSLRKSQTLALASVLSLTAVMLGGCQAERSVTPPAEPTWTYRDGAQQLSNNDQWEQMIPTTAFSRYQQNQVASVEDPTGE